MPGVSYSQMDPHAECNKRIAALDDLINQVREEKAGIWKEAVEAAEERDRLREILKAAEPILKIIANPGGWWRSDLRIPATGILALMDKARSQESK